MIDSVFYLLKVNVLFIILWMLYHVGFSRLTFFGFNRAILILVLPISFIIPLLTINPLFHPAEFIFIPDFQEAGGLIHLPVKETSVLPVSSGFQRLMAGIYWSGVLLACLRLASGAVSIIRLRRKSSSVSVNRHHFFKTDSGHAFSVFRMIFLPHGHTISTEDPIIAHEQLHGRFFHTADLIVTEILLTFIWFNPFVKFFRKSLRTLHECQVDSAMLAEKISKTGYLQLLLNHLESGVETRGIFNYFNGLTIKTRIQMITKNKSSKTKMWQYAILVPVLSLLTLAFTQTGAEPPTLFPVAPGTKYKITQTHGNSFEHPFSHETVSHKGLDIAAPEGTRILAAGGGTVIKASFEKGYGNLLIIDHGNRIQTWYAHLQRISVDEGVRVERGQVVALMGNTGQSTGPHLHFEIREDSVSIDPYTYLNKE